MAVLQTNERHNVFRNLYRDITDKPSTEALPRRVRDSIKAQDDASEVLIKIFQLVIVIFFGILYAVSRKTDAGTAFSPVPYVLVAYFVLTIIGLIWALKRTLPNWAIYISIGFDIGLLLLLIVSFHIQYNQPASFFLKAPTLLYIFLFIALRALRFQPRFVLAAGFIAAAGWASLIVYVITVDANNTMITKDYVTYLTSNSILIGGEIDKIITIIMVTIVLALVLRRGQRLFVQAVAEQTAAHDLSRFFDESVASQIRSADHEIAAGEGVQREVAVLNVDIRGFTRFAAKVSPDQVITLLSEYQTLLVPVIQGHHGTIDKFMGDGILATFGAVAESESAAADSLRAVDEIIAVAEAWAKARKSRGLEPIKVNASVALGPVIFGAIGGENRLEYTVIGSAVNLSAKLEKHNKDLGVSAVTTETCYRKALEHGYDRKGLRRTEADVDGIGEAQKLVVLHA
ncbi:adenylate cyclase 1 [bacterium MnTg02]|nr:adenylate cyclase 1 [bacterium MnTg02]